jgi:FixJ family two-component response regulator
VSAGGTTLVIDDEDLIMPGIDGFDIMHVLAENCPDLPVVCTSGFAT